MFQKNIIGLDIDDKKTGKELLRILRILKINGKYRTSSSKRGFHFKLNVGSHTKQENLKIRYMLGDCYGRWRTDIRRLQNGVNHFDVLFDTKKGLSSGKWKKI